jgi:hypothetical protein
MEIIPASGVRAVGFTEGLVKRFAITIALAAVLLGAPTANAKEPPQTAVCGRSIVGLSSLPTERACLKLSDRDEVVYQLLDQGEPFALRSRPRPAPFYTVTFQFREGRRWNWSFLYVPSRGLMRVTTSVGTVTDARDVYWRTAPATVVEAFEALSKQLRPFPAPRRWR